ncbi:phosphoribosylaminoimidazolesuccinocarboxamide synthase [bacterium]|nr:phosphoribosylaminoimidazolesuccinocarboxamide synthase [bacterium]RQV96005.1 MAG: phosphoribosylaminoimidazolesuccinocarboxamide synthase [bacterium]
MDVKKGKMIRDGRFKKIYPTNHPDQYVIQFKDDLPVIKDGKKKALIHKGEYNAAISSALFRYLEGYHIHTHFIKLLKPNEMLVKRLEMIPIEIMVWNFSSGAISKRYSIENGKIFPCPIVELYLKDKKLHYPMMTIDHVCAFGYAGSEEIQKMDQTVRKINAVLKSYFERRGFRLADFKIEFGRYQNNIVLGDEMTPDTFHLWDTSGEDIQTMEPIAFYADRIEEEYEALKNRIC